MAPSYDIVVDDRTFETIKQLYSADANALQFLFPDNLSKNTTKHLAMKIYNLEVEPNDHEHLFQNLHVDSFEVYFLYPLRGTFQQLFDGANIKYLRLTGGEIRSDVSQPFTGIIHRLEIAKQASTLSVQNFPVYPAHEMIINAFYVMDFNSEHPSNYKNLAELHVHSLDQIPANAFQDYPNIRTLSISSEKAIDLRALDGLKNLEELIIKDGPVNLEL
ncbi:hypothetical protein I4U23_004386 [Adineta vaga]|nr:hypothetical protein I4U23_004386 [Adineta vaga]